MAIINSIIVIVFKIIGYELPKYRQIKSLILKMSTLLDRTFCAISSVDGKLKRKQISLLANIVAPVHSYRPATTELLFRYPGSIFSITFVCVSNLPFVVYSAYGIS